MTSVYCIAFSYVCQYIVEILIIEQSSKQSDQPCLRQRLVAYNYMIYTLRGVAYVLKHSLNYIVAEILILLDIRRHVCTEVVDDDLIEHCRCQS